MKYIQIAQDAIKLQADSLLDLSKSLGAEFNRAIELLLNNEGRIILCGIGKSGIIAKKISSVFSSVGCASFFIHANEASHGDLGAITTKDIIVILSNSGNTKELADVISYCKYNSIKIIAIVGKKGSALHDVADISLVLPKFSEISKDIAFPSTSVTLMSVLGDVITLCLVKARKVSSEQYRSFHPGGSIGNSLIKISEIMREGDALPIVKLGTKVIDALIVMGRKSMGCVIIVDSKGILLGIITDGDLRRHINNKFVDSKVEDIMTKNPKSISKELRAIDALNYMNEKGIMQLMVIDDRGFIEGLIHMHDCLRIGLKADDE